ncbi:MAG: P-loop NTPase fold protein [Phycisphaerales bacterium]
MPPAEGSSTPTPRRQLILARWLDMLACGVVAGSAVLLLLALLGRPLGSLLAAALGPWTPEKAAVLLLAGSVLAMALLWRHGKGRWGAMLGVRHPLAYPGVAAASGFGVLGAALVLRATGLDTWGLDAAVMTRPPTWAWFVFASVIIVPPAVEKFERVRRWKARDHKNEAETLSPFPADQSQWTFKHWRDWSASDKEIHFKGDDRFDAQPIADRIAGRLVPDESKSEQPSIALIGPKGSGKSSILSLVERELTDTANIEFARISLWAYDTPEAAMRGVLDRLIETVGRHAPTLALTGLPGEYLAAVDHMAGRWGVLRLLTPPERDPLNLLKKIDRIAAAVGVRFVLAIEDFERFREGHADASSLGPIRALLYHLDQREHVSVVMASDDLDDRFDMDKIARYVERMPVLGVGTLATFLHNVRSASLAYQPDGQALNDAVDPSKRFQFKRAQLEANVAIVGDAWGMTLGAALAELADTPRVLKSAIRHSCKLWESIPGEIDIDELLVLSILRESEPTAYGFISRQDHLRAFRTHFYVHPIPGQVRVHRVRDAFHAMLKRSVSTERARAVERVAEYLFPSHESSEVPSDEKKVERDRPQGVRDWAVGFWSNCPQDYLRRFDAMDVGKQDPGDQKIMRRILDWNQQNSTGLVDAMMEEHSAVVAINFGRMLKEDRAAELVKRVVRKQDELGVVADEDPDNAVGIGSVYLMCEKSGVEAKQLIPVLSRSVCDMTGHHPELVRQLLQVFRAGRQRVAISSEDELQLHVAAVGAFVDGYVAGERYDHLAHSLANGTMYTLYHLLRRPGWHTPEIPKDGAASNVQTPNDRWDVIGPFLSRFAAEHPAVGLPVVASFICVTGHGIPQPGDPNEDVAFTIATVNPNAAEKLFGIDKLVPLYSDVAIQEEWDEHGRVCVQAAIDWANAQPAPHPQEPPE